MTESLFPTVKVRPAIFPDDKDTVSSLFLAYEQFLLNYASVRLDFQNFAHEVASLPGMYSSSNNGALYIAYNSTPATSDASAKEETIGCIGLREFSASHSGELKRLYLTPESRGLGAGRMLMDAAIARARELGYKEILLDTLSIMTVARRLYEKCGFVEIEAYYKSHPDAVFYRMALQNVVLTSHLMPLD